MLHYPLRSAAHVSAILTATLLLGCTSGVDINRTEIPLHADNALDERLAYIVGAIRSDAIPSGLRRFSQSFHVSAATRNPLSVENTSDYAGQLGWNSLPALPKGFTFFVGAAYYKYVSATTITLATPQPQPSPNTPSIATLYAQTTRWPSQCFEIGMRYDQFSAQGSAQATLYVYDFCKPKPPEPGTFVAMIRITPTIEKQLLTNVSFDKGLEPSIVVEVTQEAGRSSPLGTDDILHPAIMTSNGPLEIKASDGGSIAEPVSAITPIVFSNTGWSMFETHFAPSPEPCPSLPEFKVKDVQWRANTESTPPYHDIFGPRYVVDPKAQPDENLNSSPWLWTAPAPYNECTTNKSGVGAYYAPKYITTSNGDWLWSVSSSSSE